MHGLWFDIWTPDELKSDEKGELHEIRVWNPSVRWKFFLPRSQSHIWSCFNEDLTFLIHFHYLKKSWCRAFSHHSVFCGNKFLHFSFNNNFSNYIFIKLRFFFLHIQCKHALVVAPCKYILGMVVNLSFHINFINIYIASILLRKISV